MVPYWSDQLAGTYSFFDLVSSGTHRHMESRVPNEIHIGEDDLRFAIAKSQNSVDEPTSAALRVLHRMLIGSGTEEEADLNHKWFCNAPIDKVPFEIGGVIEAEETAHRWYMTTYQPRRYIEGETLSSVVVPCIRAKEWEVILRVLRRYGRLVYTPEYRSIRCGLFYSISERGPLLLEAEY